MSIASVAECLSENWWMRVSRCLCEGLVGESIQVAVFPPRVSLLTRTWLFPSLELQVVVTQHSSSSQSSLGCVRAGADVLRQAAGRREGLAACVAGARLVAGVHPKLLRECAGLGEGAAACVTPKWSFSRVYLSVHREVARALKRLTALLDAKLIRRCRLRLLFALCAVGPLPGARGPSMASVRVGVAGALAGGGARGCVMLAAAPVALVKAAPQHHSCATLVVSGRPCVLLDAVPVAHVTIVPPHHGCAALVVSGRQRR